MAMVNSTIVDVDDVDETVVEKLLEQLGIRSIEYAETYFEVEVVVTVILVPVPMSDKPNVSPPIIRRT